MTIVADREAATSTKECAGPDVDIEKCPRHYLAFQLAAAMEAVDANPIAAAAIKERSGS